MNINILFCVSSMASLRNELKWTGVWKLCDDATTLSNINILSSATNRNSNQTEEQYSTEICGWHWRHRTWRIRAIQSIWIRLGFGLTSSWNVCVKSVCVCLPGLVLNFYLLFNSFCSVIIIFVRYTVPHRKYTSIPNCSWIDDDK